MTTRPPTLDDLAADLHAAAAVWNTAVKRARDNGIGVKLILSGDGASIYSIQHCMTALTTGCTPPKPKG